MSANACATATTTTTATASPAKQDTKTPNPNGTQTGGKAAGKGTFLAEKKDTATVHATQVYSAAKKPAGTQALKHAAHTQTSSSAVHDNIDQKEKDTLRHATAGSVHAPKLSKSFKQRKTTVQKTAKSNSCKESGQKTPKGRKVAATQDSTAVASKREIMHTKKKESSVTNSSSSKTDSSSNHDHNIKAVRSKRTTQNQNTSSSRKSKIARDDVHEDDGAGAGASKDVRGKSQTQTQTQTQDTKRRVDGKTEAVPHAQTQTEDRATTQTQTGTKRHRAPRKKLQIRATPRDESVYHAKSIHASKKRALGHRSEVDLVATQNSKKQRRAQ
jgi:hypothetical protein